MLYSEFVEKVAKELAQYLPPDLEDIVLQLKAVQGNNDVRKHGIQVISLQEGELVALQGFVHMKDYYEEFCCGTPFKTILHMIAEDITNMSANSFFKALKDIPYEKAKEHLLVEICNEKMNRSQLNEIPHMKKCDLALRYLFCVKNMGMGNTYYTVLIRNSHLEKWGISEEILRKDAWENTKKKFPSTVRSLNETVSEVIKEIGQPSELLQIKDVKAELYILSNSANFHGAVYLLDEVTMNYLAECFEDDLIILPSSIHECLFLPRHGIQDLKVFVDMVREVNGSVVLPEEILSDNIYIYNRHTHSISVVSE